MPNELQRQVDDGLFDDVEGDWELPDEDDEWWMAPITGDGFTEG